MFAARGIAVSFSVFFLVYVSLSLAVCIVSSRLSQYLQAFSARSRADLLFFFRVLPFLGAAVVTAAFTVPSFLLLEPRAIQEPLGGAPLVLGLCGLMLALFGMMNAILALIRAAQMIAGWEREAGRVESSVFIPVLRITRSAPALTVAGILYPRVLLSGTAEFVLNENELHTALKHEVAHVRRRDNLKKLFLRLFTFPGMKSLETAWLEATEMAADDAAVGSLSDALDLAAALIKLSRMGADHQSGSTKNELRCDHSGEDGLVTAFAHCSASLVNARVERLIAWSDDPVAPVQKYSPWYAAGVALAVMAVFAVTYSQLLEQVHTATEWLVR